jgi:hypothetical protein
MPEVGYNKIEHAMPEQSYGESFETNLRNLARLRYARKQLLGCW